MTNEIKKNNAPSSGGGLKCLLVTIFIVAIYVAHQDSWNWTKATPMLFGFLPPGLAYHAGYSIWASVMMAILVKVAWPKHLEDQEDKPRQ